MQEEKIGSNEYFLTRYQVRAGRVIAGLGVRQLAAAAGMSPTGLSQIETGRTAQAHEMTLRALRLALEDQGVEFARQGWVRHEDDRDAVRESKEEVSIRKCIGRTCKRARKKLDLTLDDVAEMVGVGVEHYSRVERGSALPPLTTLIRIADALELSTDQMFGRTLASEVQTLGDMSNLDPEQAKRLSSLLGVARPSAVRVVTLILKEFARVQKRKKPR